MVRQRNSIGANLGFEYEKKIHVFEGYRYIIKQKYVII